MVQLESQGRMKHLAEAVAEWMPFDEVAAALGLTGHGLVEAWICGELPAPIPMWNRAELLKWATQGCPSVPCPHDSPGALMPPDAWLADGPQDGD